MRRINIVVCFALALLLLATLAQSQSAQTQTKAQSQSQEKSQAISRTGTDAFDVDFPSGSQLRMEMQSGDVKLAGTDTDKIAIHFEGESAEQAKNVRVKLKINGKSGELEVSGGPRNNFQIYIDVPRRTDLYVRMPFGNLEVEKIAGNKDIELHAGELEVAMGDAKDYAHVDASVSSGNLEAPQMGISKGGLFRSFNKEGSGTYRLHAHVGAGDLTLR